MRILMTAHNVGGGFTYALELCIALGTHGVEVALATRGPRFCKMQLGQLYALPNVQVFEGAFKLEWQEHPWQDISAASDWLLALEQKTRPDVIHLNDFAHGQLPFLAPVLVVAHCDVASWYDSVKKKPLPPEFSRYADAVKRGLVGADAVVAVSHSMARALQQHYGFEKAVTVIPNARSARGRPRGAKEKLIFGVGKLGDPARNLSMLASVAARVPWQIAVGGDDTGVEAVSEKVHRLGALTPAEIAQMLSKASIFALPARYEPSNIGITEAALGGCALVLGDTPWTRELWDGCAEFVDPEDPDDLAVSLNLLIEDEDRRRRLGLSAHTRAAQRSPEKQALAYVQVYRELVKSRVVWDAEIVA